MLWKQKQVVHLKGPPLQGHENKAYEYVAVGLNPKQLFGWSEWLQWEHEPGVGVLLHQKAQMREWWGHCLLWELEEV